MVGEVVQKWSCVVEDIVGDSVFLRLYDLTDDSDLTIEEAELSLEEFTSSQRSRLITGSFFKLSIYLDLQGNSFKVIEFIPILHINEGVWDELLNTAKEKYKNFNWD